MEIHHALLSMATGYVLGEVGYKRMHMQDSGMCSTNTNAYPPFVLFPPSSTPNEAFLLHLLELQVPDESC